MSVPKQEVLVKTVSVDLIKPLGEDTWETVGQRLRDLRGCSHRLLNAGIRAAALGDQASKDVAQSARDGVKQALAGERDYWRSRLGKKRYEGSNHDPAMAERLSELALPSVIEDHIASRAGKMFIDARKHMWRGDKSLPSAKWGAPIPLRNGDGAWLLTKTDEGWELALKIFPANSAKVRFAVRVHSSSAHADLRRMIGSDAKLGDARIVWNKHAREHKGQWEARLCYSYPKPSPADGTEAVAVHRGMHQLLTIVDSKGLGAAVLPGEAWKAAKLGFSARRRSLMKHIRAGELGHGARGRGVQRRYKALRSIDDAEARMMRSACQQAAARVITICQRIGASVVLIEDYATIRPDIADKANAYVPTWPWAQLKGAVAWACQKAGVTLTEVPSSYISITCPACQNIDKDQVRDRMFECRNAETACALRISVDTVAALNMLRTSGVDMGPGPDGLTPVQRVVKNAQALAASMRKKKSDDTEDKAAE